jgi:hypothetical protein
LATLLVADLSQSLKVFVEHSGKTNQTHTLGSVAFAGSDYGATPRTNNIVVGF